MLSPNRLPRRDPPPKSAVALVWRFRSPHHSSREFAMRISEPKPHEINKLLVSFDSEVRKRGCRKMMRTSESGHSCGGSEVRIHSSRELAMRTSEPKPHEINKV